MRNLSKHRLHETRGISKSLDLRRCHASYVEDKEMILNRIPDIDGLNRWLRGLLAPDGDLWILSDEDRNALGERYRKLVVEGANVKKDEFRAVFLTQVGGCWV